MGPVTCYLVTLQFEAFPLRLEFKIWVASCSFFSLFFVSFFFFFFFFFLPLLFTLEALVKKKKIELAHTDAVSCSRTGATACGTVAGVPAHSPPRRSRGGQRQPVARLRWVQNFAPRTEFRVEIAHDTTASLPLNSVFTTPLTLLDYHTHIHA